MDLNLYWFVKCTYVGAICTNFYLVRTYVYMYDLLSLTYLLLFIIPERVSALLCSVLIAKVTRAFIFSFIRL